MEQAVEGFGADAAASEATSGASTLADSAGMCASIACAIHCAAMPLVIGYLPLLGLSWLADESFHRVMALVCFAFAVLAFVPGWRRHRSLVPGAVGAFGVGLLAVASFGLEGSCCPTVPAATETASVCEHTGCTLCPTEAESAEPPLVAASGFPAWALPLVTPLGGVLLIAAHVTNRRKSCGCDTGGCCSEHAVQVTEITVGSPAGEAVATPID